jgi:hypothetical protein
MKERSASFGVVTRDENGDENLQGKKPFFLFAEISTSGKVEGGMKTTQ